MTPGRTLELTVHLWPIHYRVEAGHRLVLTVSSDDHPQIASDAPEGSVSVRTGARGSTLELQLRTGAR